MRQLTLRIASLLSIAAAIAAQNGAPKPTVTPAAAAAYSANIEPTSIEWSPDGKAFAFVEAGRVRVYQFDGAKEIALVKLSDLTATTPPSGGPFEWTNRGAKERRLQWLGNQPALLVKERGDLFEVPLSGQWRQLTATPVDERDPKVSRDGKYVAFGRDHDLSIMEIASGKVTRLTRDGTPTLLNGELDWVYPEELALESAFWWSPDSSSIAFLQFDTSPVMLYPQADLTGLRPVAEAERFPQAGTPNSRVRLGVVGRNGGSVRWLDTGAAPSDLLARVDWTADSKSLLVRQLTRTQQQLTFVSIAAAGGKPKLMWEERDPAWVNLRDDFAQLDGGRFLWGSDRSGYRHLYVYGADGKLERQITSGDWEVTELNCVNAQWAYFTSTEASPTGRRMYRVMLDGSGKEEVTASGGSHQVSVGPGCERWLDTHSTLQAPPQMVISSGGIFRKPQPHALDYSTSEPELLTFRGADGTLFHARLTRPVGFDRTKKYPAVVMVYGGPHAQRVRDQWRGADLDQALAARGFVVWEMDNRGTAGRGHVFETPLYHRFGKLELADQLEGVRYLISLGYVDAARVGIHGWSYGGFMTLTAMLGAPHVFKAGIAGAPVTDWRDYDTIYSERYLGLPAENEEGYRLSSPVNAAAQLKGRLMLVHNFEDDNVLLQHTMRMANALQQAGKQFDFMLYPQKTHHVAGVASIHLYESMVEFFVRNLAPQ